VNVGKVRVELVDEEGAPIGGAELDGEQLPESFEARTTLELGGATWEVVRAEPRTRADYVASGRLSLVLRRLVVAEMAPKDILYSLPTINDALPAVAEGSTKQGKRTFELHEDDWRQVELVARELGGVVEAQLASVRRIRAAHRGPGFKELHVRTQPTSPLVERHLTLDALARALPGARPYDGVSFANAAGLVRDGFAYDAGDLQVYGVAPDGIITTLAVRPAEPAAHGRLDELAGEHALLVVDWCAAAVRG
jgi:hypothetical protein